MRATALVAVVVVGLAGLAARDDNGDTAAVATPVHRPTKGTTAEAAVSTTTTSVAVAAPSTVGTAAPAVRLRAPAVRRATTASTVKRGQAQEVRVTMASQDRVPTGTLVETAVSIRGASYPVIGAVLDYGDGTTGARPRLGGGRSFVACDARGPAGDHGADYTFGHGYRRSRTYDVRLVKVILACGEEITFDADPLRLTIVPGPDRSNGPELPTSTNCILNLESFCVHNDGLRASVYGGFSDPDGYVESVLVDWGDGTPPGETHFPLAECQDPGDRFPSNERSPQLPDHRYEAPGTYTVMLTIVSTGCDGKDTQQRAFDEELTINP